MNIGLQFKARARLPVILQNEIAQCGHACVLMIANYVGHTLDLAAIAKIAPASHRGVTLRDIIGLFDQLGCASRAVRVEMEALKYLKTPAILHWNMNHCGFETGN